MGGNDQRDRILRAAERVLFRKGLTAATLDMMAAEAGLTKGGLFYYFDGKRDVVMAILDLYSERIHEKRKAFLEAMPTTGHAFFKATAMAMLEYMRVTRADMSNIGGILDVPEYRDKLLEIKNRLFAEVEERYPHRDKITIAFVIMDGLGMNNIFKNDMYYQGSRQAIEDYLMRFIDSLD